MAARAYAFHYESRATLDAPVEVAFAYLDDFHKLSAHMERSSWMMLGSKMRIETDSAGGRAVGSRVRMSGKALGLTLALEEVVSERNPPLRKAWETANAKLLVIGRYRLGFELEREGCSSALRVFIDYDLPLKPPARWLGRAFASRYAQWCAERMLRDAIRHLGRQQLIHVNGSRR